ncbi:MAG TPA: tetratricopeptide repeat protein, partial [Sandaracinaceae bacterium]
YWLGACYHHLGRTTEAIAEYEAAREKGIEELGLLRALGGLYDHAGRLMEAVQAYERILAMTPADAEVRYTAGVAYVRLGQRDRARAQYRWLRPLSAQKAEALYRLMLG